MTLRYETVEYIIYSIYGFKIEFKFIQEILFLKILISNLAAILYINPVCGYDHFVISVQVQIFESDFVYPTGSHSRLCVVLPLC